MEYNDIKQELSENFIEYAAAVNSDRAIPDSGSGLKPVARRILWAAYTDGYSSSKPHVKSARVVGEVMGRYHPHADSSIYGALVRLSQDWVMRYPLIDIHGNNGNITGDDAAHMRYTEARLTKLAEDGLLAGIKKKNVDFMSNYDETEEEPVTLPAIFPNLLCNPNTGIGVAMAASWAPHNLREVAEAIFDYMDGKEPMLPGPDFPTGGVVINKDDIPNIMKTGHGTVKVRGSYKIEKQNIVFYEIPYNTTIEDLLNEISTVCDNKEVEGISEIRDESNKKGLRLVIQCEKNANPEIIVNKLFAKTNLQSSFSYNQVALIDKTPTELNLKQCIEIYINHNLSCIQKEAQFDLKKAKDRQHIVEGLLKALVDIDEIIATIKQSENAVSAKNNLISKYGFSEEQAKAITDMKLGKLAGLERIELENENAQLITQITELNSLINSKENQVAELRERLVNLVKKYGDDRRTKLIQLDIPKETKEKIEIVPEDVIVTLSQNGNLARVRKNEIKKQKKGGKGTKAKNEIILDSISTNTLDSLMFFTTLGKMFKIPVNSIPDTSNVNINSLLKLDPNDAVVAGSALHKGSPAEYAVFFTKQGLIKKTLIDEYTSIKKGNGVAAIKLKDGDSIANLTFLNDEDVIVITKNGMTIRFETKNIAPIGRLAAGVRAIKLSPEDEVVIGLPVHKDTDALALITSDGYGKRCNLAEIAKQQRSGKGIGIYKNTSVVGAAMVDNADNLFLNGTSSICVASSDLPLGTKVAVGARIVQGHVASVTKLKSA